MVEIALRDLSRTISTSQRQFRDVASENNRSITKFAKDIATSFASQRKQSIDTNNSIAESLNASQQAATKVDATNSLLQESVTLQSRMIDELKNIRAGIRSLADAIVQSGGLGGGSVGQGLAGSAAASGLRGLLRSGGGLAAGAAGLGIAAGAGYLDYSALRQSASDAAAAANTGGAGGAGGTNRTAPNTNFTGKEAEAKKAAEKYLGREMTPNEWSELIRATSAEAGRSNQTEVAMVMATILNRARDKNKSIEEILRERNQFQAVTGTRNNPNPSPNFVNMPNDKRLEQIFGASTNILDKVSREQRNFTAASSAAYGAGTNIGFRDRMIASGGSTVGGSVFNTAPPDLSSLTPSPSSSSTDNTASGQTPSQQTTSANENSAGAKQGHAQALERGVGVGLAKKLQEIESAFGGKLNVTSGARSEERNRSVGGAGNSAHLRGNAVDVTFNGGVQETLKLIEAASKAGIGGIGVYGPGSVHLDVESKRAWGPNYRRGSVPQWAESAIRAHETNKWGEYDASARGGENATRMGGGQMVGAGLGGMGGGMIDPMAMMGMMGGGKLGAIAGLVGAFAPALSGLLGGMGGGGGQGQAPQPQQPAVGGGGFDFKQFSMLPEDQQTSARFFEADRNEQLRRTQNIQQRAVESRAQEQTAQERMANPPPPPPRPEEFTNQNASSVVNNETRKDEPIESWQGKLMNMYYHRSTPSSMLA